jgi:predicted transcriptional regulator/DNA-binding XRE family transcriptional regulator
MQKTFIGPHLRRLRLDRGETQAQMARALGISASYVNLLENNERSVSVQVLLKLFEVYGVDWRTIADDEDPARLADLRAALQDPIFDGARPDLAQLRAAQVHAPALSAAFLQLYRSHQAATDRLVALAGARGPAGEALLAASPETEVHDFFRRNRNYFHGLEQAAEAFWGDDRPAADDVYAALKARLAARPGLRIRVVAADTLPRGLRALDEDRGELLLSEVLDHPNRVFQLVHVAALVEHRALLGQLLAGSGIADAPGRARARVELANYFAAAVLMPYAAFLADARASKYDLDHLATRYGVSYEQACHRATTLQRRGAQGVPLFFLRIDKAGNVTKRFNATDFHLAEQGGACPRLDIHTSFRTPGRMVTQFVEMPDQSQYFVFARTVNRPTFIRHAQDVRLAVAMGCAVEHAAEIGYAEGFSVKGAHMTPVGINCRICPRAHCDQRAHQAVILPGPSDERRRGATRYES